jgi:hypothetical protein
MEKIGRCLRRHAGPPGVGPAKKKIKTGKEKENKNGIAYIKLD